MLEHMVLAMACSGYRRFFFKLTHEVTKRALKISLEVIAGISLCRCVLQELGLIE